MELVIEVYVLDSIEQLTFIQNIYFKKTYFAENKVIVHMF